MQGLTKVSARGKRGSCQLKDGDEWPITCWIGSMLMNNDSSRRVSDIVFILGASASKQCGAPLMADFLDVANNLKRTGGAKDKSEHFDNVFRAIGALQAVHSKAQLNLTNIESIFTALEISNVLKKLPGFESEEIPSVIASLNH
jgi:hypothetical protein